MACISKLASAIAYDCDTGTTGLTSAIIINKADIKSYVVEESSMTVSGFTLAAGAKAYKIEPVKRSLVLSTALKVNERAPNAYSHSATIVATGILDALRRGTMSAFTNGSYVIMAKTDTLAAPRIYGLYYGMSVTSVEQNSHENGNWVTYTLETPENVIGEDPVAITVAGYDTLYAAAVG